MRGVMLVSRLILPAGADGQELEQALNSRVAAESWAERLPSSTMRNSGMVERLSRVVNSSPAIRCQHV